MDKAFLTILNMSFTGTFIIAVVCIARLLLKKAPKIISYFLWAVAGFRLIFPFSIESVFSFMPFQAQPIPPDIAMQRIPRIDGGKSFIINAANSVLPAATPAASANPLQIWLAIGAYIWMIGVAAMLVYGVVSFAILKCKMRSAVHLEENIYEAFHIQSPFVLGFFSPKIYMPAGLLEKEREYIILHEQTHIRRRDHIIKFLAYFILCLHWFNPLVWVAFLLMSADMEMSCDERVLKEAGSKIKKDYSLLLLSLATQRRAIGVSPLAFGEGGIKERVKNVLNFKKPSRPVIIAAVAVAAVLSAGFGLNRASGNNQNNKLLLTLGYTRTLLTDSISNRTTLSEGNDHIDRIVKSLPLPAYREYHSFSVQSEPSKEININWEFGNHYNRDGNGLDPFYGTVEENNALILFASVDGLEKVNFLSYDNYDNKELNRVDSYTINDLAMRFGDINPFNMSISDLDNALGANIYLSEYYFAHYSRIYLGADPEDVSYRNGKPNEIRKQPDGSAVWIYSNPGQAYNPSSDDSGMDHSEHTAIYYFNSPQAEKNNHLTGLYATRFIHADNYGKTYDDIVEALGYPSVIKSIGISDKYMAYSLIAEHRNTNAYFILHHNKVVEEGVMYGEDYKKLDLK